MKIIISQTLCALALLFLPLNIFAQEVLTLNDCYQLALKQSETLAIQKQVLKEAEGRFAQSLATILPRLSFGYAHRYQEEATTSTPKSYGESGFILSQPLFSGFKEFAAVAGSRAEQRQRRHEIERAKELLFIDVSDAFYLYLLYDNDLKTLNTIRNALDERVSELNRRQELGRSRLSEVANANARLRRIEADIAALESDMLISRQLLEFLIGRSFSELKDDDSIDLKHLVLSLDTLLEKSSQRHDVLAAKEAWNVAQRQITVARAGYFPVATLDGNYYTKRVGSSANIDWDATLNVSVPIFYGGENYGKVKESKALAEEARLNFQATQRNADLDIKNNFTRFQSLVRQTDLLEKALLATEKNYQLQTEDYRLNLVNNLEVLQALEDWQISRREFTSADSLMRRAYWSLKASVGEIPNDSF